MKRAADEKRRSRRSVSLRKKPLLTIVTVTLYNEVVDRFPKQPTEAVKNTRMPDYNAMDKLQWEIYVPIFRNRYIMRGLGIAIGIPFGLLIAMIIILSGGDIAGTDAKYALGLIAALFLLSFLLVMILYGGKYAPGFIVDETGIVNYTQEKQTKRNRVVNGLLIALGAISGNPTAMGTGMIAQSRQVVRLKWKKIRKVRYDAKRHTILVRGAYTEKIAVFCTPENYPLVSEYVRQKTGIPG